VKHITSIRVFSLLLLLGGVGSVSAARLNDTASAAEMQALERKIYVGIGAGYESGNGLRLGASIGRHGLETGFGITYAGETGMLNYSYGLRYLNTLYDGAYAWIGAGQMGHRQGSDRERLRSMGAGLGISWKLGSMFRLMLDSGWHLYSATDLADGNVQINPTINGALVYIW
jgi:hypothetical protein